MLESLVTPDTRIKVSSTLDKSVGKQCLRDNDPETCWTSQQGLPQYIQLGFTALVVPKRITFTFQGGFVGTRCALEIPVPAVTKDTEVSNKVTWRALTRIYPEDVNRRQSFDLEGIEPDLLEAGVESLRLVFEESSDFFGRITVYDLKVEGIVL